MFSDYNARIFQPPKVANSFFLFSVVRPIFFFTKNILQPCKIDQEKTVPIPTLLTLKWNLFLYKQQQQQQKW